jgi:hypothetical protein
MSTIESALAIALAKAPLGNGGRLLACMESSQRNALLRDQEDNRRDAANRVPITMVHNNGGWTKWGGTGLWRAPRLAGGTHGRA